MSTPAGIRSPFSARPPWAERWTLRRHPSDSLRLFSSPLLSFPYPLFRSSLTFRQDGSRTPEGTCGRVVPPLLSLCFASLNLRSSTPFLTSGSGPGRQRCQVSLVFICLLVMCIVGLTSRAQPSSQPRPSNAHPRLSLRLIAFRLKAAKGGASHLKAMAGAGTSEPRQLQTEKPVLQPAQSLSCHESRRA